MSEHVTGIFFTGVVGITAVVFLVLAVVSLRAGLRTLHHKLWLTLCVCLASQMAIIAMSPHYGSSAQAEVAFRTSMSLGALNQFLFLAFAIAFTQLGRGGRSLGILNIAWGGSLIALIWSTDLVFESVVANEVSGFAPVAGVLAPLFLFYIVFTWPASIVILYLASRKATGARRSQVLYVLAAYAIGLFASAGFMLTTMVRTSGVLLFLPAALFVVFSMTITYVIVRHRLLGIRTIVHLTTVWGGLLVALLVPLYGILWAAAALELELRTWEVALLLTFLFMLSYGYIQVLKPRIDHVFARGTYDRRKVIEAFERSMSGLGKPEDVARQIVETLGATLYPERTAVYFVPGKDRPWNVVAEGGGPDPNELDLGGLFVWRLAEVGVAVERTMVGADPRFEDVIAEAEAHFARAAAQVAVPMVRGEDVIGVVYLGPRRNLGPYTSEDLEFLDQVGAAAAMGLANALLFEQVDAQRRDLAELAHGLEDKVRERTEELERVNAELTRANEALRELDRLKSRFFANISHELRTPLTLILVPLGAMLGGGMGAFDDEQKKQLFAIRRSALELLRLINDLLDLSKLEEAQLKLRVSDVDMVSLIERIVGFSRPLAERKRIEVGFSAEAHPVVEADEEKLERVLVNLLTNAFKFTEEGGTVSVNLWQREGRVVVSVEDTGIGIPVEALEKIFDRFHQVDDSTVRVRGGTGIGLALVKEIVDLHMGTLNVESQLGRGSTFTVEIPLRADRLPVERIDRRVTKKIVPFRRREDDQGLPEWNAEIVSSTEYRFLGLERATERRVVPRDVEGRPLSAKLIVVDDNPDMLRYVHRILGRSYNVMPVQDGERAWELVLRERPDLVVTDVMMPGVSGLDLCRRIRKDPRVQDTPVVLLTARGGPEYRIEGHGVGADEYIEKPFEADELLAAVGGLLRSRARRAEVAARRQTATLETLLAGMAHELRNAAHQMQSAHAVMQKLAREGIGNGGRADLEEKLERMDGVSRRAMDRIGKVVRGLQQYAAGHMHVPWNDLALDDLVEKEVRMVTGADGKDVALELSLRSGARVRGPAEEIRQMVLNLVENAVQAVGRSGRVRVGTEPADGKVRLVVTDDGCGIPAGLRDRVFDPFFTTKDPGQGMGLGLALCRKTVTSMGGTIDITSEEGAGTEVVVTLPVIVADRIGMEVEP